jgi:Fe2+ transport system protein FeoA
VPSIRVAGKRLEEMGFACGDRVRLIVENGKITIHKK